ncbi:hypothetical protein J7G21_001154 [Vibrio parahaemolyticus]|nr:hypothetical protein [Vibrio parahaemolyticus]MBM5059534.1 hypothetical protein [Vibrio parahaemolyticus]TOA80804.1 hypothetical protein CGK20_21015 [Vibrio parahaemolyticus]
MQQDAELNTKLLTLNSNVKPEARVSNPTDKTELAKCVKGYWEALSHNEKEPARKNDDEKVRTSKRLPHREHFPYSATGKFVKLANQQVQSTETGLAFCLLCKLTLR